jgi:glycosyltransferase involved in cell wall biosynthesis
MSRPLKFCHISSFYPPYSFGGDAMYLYRLVNLLARHGHEVDVIHCVDSYKVLARREPEQQFPNHPNVTVHSLRSRLGPLSPLIAQQIGTSWPKTDSILEVLYSKKFDIIHYHNISLLGPKVLLLQPDYSDFLKLYTIHEHWLVCPMHVLWKNNKRLCDKPDCFRCTLKFGRPPQWWRYTRLLGKCVEAVDAFISPSLFTLRMHQERGFVSPILFVPHFVPEQGSSIKGPSPHARPYFLFVGRLEKIKGIETLLPIFERYSHADLLIAGTGTFERELRQQAENMTNVLFLGPLAQESLREFYAHTIALIVPSSGYEVFGLVILEAYQQRTPVIARDLGGLSEIVEQSQGGFLYRRTEELLVAMERLRTDPILRRDMGDRGYQTYRERWTELAHLDAYFRVIDEAAVQKLGIVPWHATTPRSLRCPTKAQV